MLKKVLAIFLFIICIFLSFYVDKAEALKDSTIYDNYTFDTNKDWKIYLSLAKEDKKVQHSVDAILVDENAGTITVLYQGERKSIKYPLTQVRSIMFFRRGFGNIHIFNN